MKNPIIMFANVSEYFVEASNKLGESPQSLVRTIEKYDLRGFPVEGEPVNGWFCRYATSPDDEDRDLRGTSATLDSGDPFEVEIFRSRTLQEIISLYERRGSRAVLHVTPLTETIYRTISRQGFVHVKNNDVVFGLLDDMNLQDSRSVVIYSSLTPEWFEPFLRLKGAEKKREMYEKALGSIKALDAYAVYYRNREVVACVSAVYDHAYTIGGVGIYNLVVRQDLRGQHIGRELVSHVLLRAKHLGAAFAHAQTSFDRNLAARGALEAVGFRRAYPYGYWEKPKPAFV